MIPVIVGRRRSEDAGGSPPRINVVAIAILLSSLTIGALMVIAIGNPVPIIVMALVGVVLMQSPRISQQWERGVILRLGRFDGLRGPGLFWIVPFIDRLVVDRSADDHDELCRRADAHVRHRAGQR